MRFYSLFLKIWKTRLYPLSQNWRPCRLWAFASLVRPFSLLQLYDNWKVFFVKTTETYAIVWNVSVYVRDRVIDNKAQSKSIRIAYIIYIFVCVRLPSLAETRFAISVVSDINSLSFLLWESGWKRNKPKDNKRRQHCKHPFDSNR